MNYPTWQEIFAAPWPTPNVECPQAWQGDSVAVQFTDREIVRLLANCCWFTPPISEQAIDEYAQLFNLMKRQAEERIRRGRNANQR
jgi:hypothetical protein